MSAGPEPPAGFHTTRWSLVLEAGRPGSDDRSRRALGELFEAYAEPLYAYLRRTGSERDEAEDLVQALFLLLLRRGDLARVDPARGRFRAWLLTAARHLRSNERAAARAEIRGGGRAPLSLDLGPAEERFLAEPADPRSPEAAFDAAWARATLGRALEALEADYRAAGRGPLFGALRPLLDGAGGGELSRVAAALGLSSGAAKMALHRLRNRFREALRREVQGTLSDERDLEEELAALQRALEGPAGVGEDLSPEGP